MFETIAYEKGKELEGGVIVRVRNMRDWIELAEAYYHESGEWRACSNSTPIYLYPAEARALAAALLAAVAEAEAQHATPD